MTFFKVKNYARSDYNPTARRWIAKMYCVNTREFIIIELVTFRLVFGHVGGTNFEGGNAAFQ